jgi:hypothetical protein
MNRLSGFSEKTERLRGSRKKMYQICDKNRAGSLRHPFRATGNGMIGYRRTFPRRNGEPYYISSR